MAGFFSKLSAHKSRATGLTTPNIINQWQDENDPRVSYHLRPRARRISIKMDAAKRSIMVTVPGNANRLKDAQRFVREKYDWILVQLETLPPSQPFIDGGEILFFGEMYILRSPDTRGRPSIDHETREICVPANPDTLEGRTKRFLIREARGALTDATQKYANILSKTVDKISVRDTSSRWGSCVKGNLVRGGQISYSWRLICAPPYVLDYVCAHECAHLVEANHGAGFWDLCDELVDTVKPAKHWLKQNAGRLHAVGAAH
ncbi:MAG: hypothetical protein COA43_03980 [Robiginitomaculum sp.]|nr:MAG: hypothetical protein COA43_03980 [Robiginitomaculum sp.]